jgi:hypothetical protein
MVGMKRTRMAPRTLTERTREERVAPLRTLQEGCAMQWNGQSGVREFRLALDADPDSHAPDEEPARVCIGEICEPLS